MKNIKIAFLIFVSICSFKLAKGQNKTENDSLAYYTKRFITATNQYSYFPDNSYYVYSKCYNYFKKSNNYEKAAQSLYQMSDYKKAKGKTSKAFELLWEALYYVEKTNNNALKAVIHRKISFLYDFFNKTQESTYHFQQALNFSKKIDIVKGSDRQQLNANYLNLASRKRNAGDFLQAMIYLDSLEFSKNMVSNGNYVYVASRIEKANLLINLKDPEKTAKILYKLKSDTDKKNTKHKTKIYFALGELNKSINQSDSAIYYYEQSLKFIDKLNFNVMLLPKVISELANQYVHKNRARKAYFLLKERIRITDSINNLRTDAYADLFEIKNSYLESIRKKDNLLEEKNSIIEEKEETQFLLKLVLALVILITIIIIFIGKMRLKLRKTILEKKQTELQSTLNKQKIEAKMELKSKELTSYALQLIDKDSAIDDLLNVLKEKAPSSYKSLSNKYKKGAENLWDEFNLRFTEVNSEFYTRLKEKHPNFTPTEQKHCALIKLKFTTKEMARILNIEAHSVNISRSRIRKKIGLKRSDSLETYVTNL